MDPDQTQGVINELQKQRNDALNQMALQAGTHAQVRVALDKANKRIAELEAAAKKGDPATEKVTAPKPKPIKNGAAATQ